MTGVLVKGVPSTVPSLGVTTTLNWSPTWTPATVFRSSVWLVAFGTGMPLCSQAKLNVTESPSGSWLVTVAASVEVVNGVVGVTSAASTIGGLLATLALALVGGPWSMPSNGVTTTVILSPLLPWPTWLRSNVSLLVFPAIVLVCTGIGLSFTIQS